MKRPMIVRVTKDDFELDDGRIYQHPEPLDYEPSLEKFQKIYDEWFNRFVKIGLVMEDANGRK